MLVKLIKITWYYRYYLPLPQSPSFICLILQRIGKDTLEKGKGVKMVTNYYGRSTEGQQVFPDSIIRMENKFWCNLSNTV